MIIYKYIIGKDGERTIFMNGKLIYPVSQLLSFDGIIKESFRTKDLVFYNPKTYEIWDKDSIKPTESWWRLFQK